MSSMTELKKLFEDIFPEDCIRENEPMSSHTSFRIGGPADIFIVPDSEEHLKEGIMLCREQGIPYTVLGSGSNVLVGDKGIRGAVFCMDRPMDGVDIREEDGKYIVTAGAGISMMKLASVLMVKGIKGFEFASGIPGRLGGGLFMNAGAYGGELKDIVVSARVLDADGNIKDRSLEELDLSYRHSAVQENGDIVLSVTMELQKGDPAEIKAEMDELKRKRVEKQPVEYPSAGSTFKRPEGYFAGKMISDSGLKGRSRGGAQVSEKHAGFIINTGDATASDVRGLIDEVSETVYRDSGVRLVPEVRFIGEF